MSKLPDINAKIAYLTRKVPGKRPKLKMKRPMYLKDSIKSGMKRSTELGTEGCSKEMDSFLVCLEENNFLDANCTAELTALMACDKQLQDMKRDRLEQLKKGEEVDGKVNTSVINKELRKYSNPINQDSLNIQRNLLNTLPILDRKPYPYKTKSSSQAKNDNGLKVFEK
ncbi:uncharacterized protein LOC120337343 [Styela clava]